MRRHLHLASIVLAVVSVVCDQACAQMSPLHGLSGTSALDRMGAAVAFVGDMDGDGTTDFAVGEPGWDATSMVDAGRVRVHSGGNAAVLLDIVGPGGSFGSAIAAAGDVNGDGTLDVIVGAPGLNMGAGWIGTFSGADGSLLFSKGGGAGDNYGRGVAGLGDLNGDGFDDVVVGAIGTDGNGSDAGRVHVYAGPTGALLYQIDGSASGDRLGFSVSSAGDLDGDGVQDFIAGAPYADPAGSNSGTAQVHSGATGALLLVLNGTTAGGQAGRSVAMTGDLDSDGLPDLVVGAPADSTAAASAGAARVYSGATGTLIQTVTGSSVAALLGSSVVGGDDVDGDGFADFAVAAPLDDTAGTNFGLVTIYSGASGAVIQSITGTSAMNFGEGLALGGDANGDGFGDLIIGSPGDSSQLNHAGSCMVLTAPHLPYRHYRSGSGLAHRLSASWLPDGSNPASVTGTIEVDGASPGAFGLYGASLASTDFPFFGYVPLLIAIDSVNLVATGNFGYDILGEIILTGLSRQIPPLSASVLHIQFFESGPVISSSNAIRFELVP